jgi:hypothetical protein
LGVRCALLRPDPAQRPRLEEIRDNLEARIIEAKREGWLDVAKPATRFRDLGSDYHTNRVTTQRRLRNHIAQLTAMGYQVTLEPAA